MGMQPLPPEAKKVFAGQIFDVYQWRQRLYDGSYAIFERLKRLDTVEIIPVTTDGTILMVEEEQPDHSPVIGIPAGRIEPDEQPATAAARELREETGYTAAEIKLWKTERPFAKIEWTVYRYIAYGCQKAGEQQLDAGEKISVLAVDFDRFLAEASKEQFRMQELTSDVLRARIEPEKMAELKKLLTIH
ncbi:NUDIX hydrolase [Patescibacteria group bacterium]|nr:NUDIX hydrolase [Patescibacteria group bacterium]